MGGGSRSGLVWILWPMMISISILKHRIEAGGNIIPQESPSSQSRMSDGPVEKWTSSWASLLGSITAIGCIQYLSFCRTFTTHMLRMHAAVL